MKKWWIIGGIALVVLCLGCGIGAWAIGKNAPAASSKPLTSAAAASSSAPSTKAAAASPTPTPVVSVSPPGAPRDDAAYLAGLHEIDPGLVANESRALRRAEETCADIKAGLSGDALAARVVARLSGGNATINTAQARRAIALMQTNICR